MDLEELVESRLQEASDRLGLGVVMEVKPSKPGFGHYQCSTPLSAAKRLGRSPRELAQELVDACDLSGMVAEVAGPGFVNVTLGEQLLGSRVAELLTDPHLGVEQVTPKSVVVDYSSPNVAKEMHVGHLRSSVIGDSLVRVLGAQGHDVTRKNHIGDWGTQFGMLLEEASSSGADLPGLDLADLADLYRQARAHFDADPAFADASRSRVVALQGGDPVSVAAWQEMVRVSQAAFEEVYAELGVLLEPSDTAAESSYNDSLPSVVEDLEALGLVSTSAGAKCAFPAGFTSRSGDPLPLILEKSDGGYGYDVTDLAALRARAQAGADEVLYVVDSRQALHFAMVFKTAQEAGWTSSTRAVHVPFGTVLGTDGKPLKTRSGVNVTLKSLLEDAQEAAGSMMMARAQERGLPTEGVRDLARAVGVGALKYADLSSDRVRDYTFTLEKMVALDGDTGPYLQYAHARTCSLLAKVGAPTSTGELTAAHPKEVELALVLDQFGAAVALAAAELSPHRVCTYLHTLATTLSSFYEACNVSASTGTERASRLALVELTRRVLARGLGLLGIEAPERL